MTSSNNQRIAKNTAFLYIRMLLVMGVGLFTSRIVLQNLGIDDFGIYNVVGGVVSLFSFLNLSLTNASSRFISTALGKGDEDSIKTTFSAIVTIHFALAIIVLLFAETVGLWFLLNKMVIPVDRIYAAKWVFQCSVVTMIFSVMTVPFNALIVSHERMSAFAYISIFEVFCKLGIAFMIGMFHGGKSLIIYAISLALLQLCVGLFYLCFSRRNFVESRFHILWHKTISKEILKFAGWTMNGNLAVIGYTQGINILLNLFFGPAVNAARGLSVQVQVAVRNFFMSFQTALNPQIIKSYAKGDFTYMHTLIIFGSKASFYLVLIISVPIIFNTSYILQLWLNTVPEYTAQFVQIMLLICMNNSLGNLLAYGIHATGNLKKYQLIEGGLLLSVLPIVYICLKYLEISPIQVFIIYFIIEVMTQAARIMIVCPEIHMGIKTYCNKVLLPIILTLCTSLLLPFAIYLEFNVANKFSEFFISATICLLWSMLSIYIIGLSKEEKILLISQLKAKFQRI